jgi:hypothetical protein
MAHASGAEMQLFRSGRSQSFELACISARGEGEGGTCNSLHFEDVAASSNEH